MDEDPLSLDPDTMRALADRVVDAAIRHSRQGRPGLGSISRMETESRFGGPPPEDPVPIDELLARFEDVAGLMARTDHPGFFAFIPGQPTWPGALADLFASALDLHATDWMETPGPSQIELTVIDWLKEWVGYPDAAGGVFGSGGSAANMTALACAREVRVGAMRNDLVVYLSDQAHSSMARAARILGFRPDQVRVLPVDERFRMRPEALESVMQVDERAGRLPLFVAASAGSTNTGAIDPLGEIAEVSAARGAWFHVDAAYGGGALLSGRGAEWLRGIERADSITLDPHKWMYQPYECGVLLVRDLEHLQRAFEITPEYLKDVQGVLLEPNFADLGIQLTRSARAFKLWVSMSYFGVAAFRQSVERALDLATYARARIESSESLELVAPPSLGVLCFRRIVPGASDDVVESINQHIVSMIAEGGESFISSTRLRGRFALRMVVMNHSTQREDIDRLLDAVEDAPVDTVSVTAPSAVRPNIVRRGDSLDGYIRGSDVAAGDLQKVPLFEGLSPEEVAAIARIGHERTVKTGGHLIEQWDATRELLILLDGTAEVLVDERRVAAVHAGDFVGEIAALEWHEGYTYPRTAAIVATSPVRLFVIPGGIAPRIARDFPVVGSRLTAAINERLARL
jgi:aromatic-L-amino-acid decarboxylase